MGLIQFIQLHLKAVFVLMDLACLMEIVLVAHKIIMQQKDIVWLALFVHNTTKNLWNVNAKLDIL